MLPEQTKQRIEQEAQHRYSKHKEGLYKDNCVACYIAGATTEAERSAAWKAEATLLINKIHDWAEGDKTLPLGHSVFDEAVKRLKAYDELLKAKAEPGDKSVLPDNKDREMAEDLKELDAAFEYLYKHEGVKDAGNGWIAFSDKWNAFKRKLTNKP